VSAVTFQAVTYRYPEGAAPALAAVDLSLEEGELCVLAGLSGSGKSTLLAAACGLVPHFHGGEFAGRVTVAGMDTRDHGPGELAVACGTLLQDPETQVVMGTVRAELAFPLENRGHAPAAVARGVEEIALALGIESILDRPTPELSGGELQRVALGAALAGRPRVVLLDEPTSQLDPVAGDELVWLLRRLNEEWGATVVIAEQRLERCLAAADRVVALDEGRVVYDAAPSEFLEWACRRAPALATPGARLCDALGVRPLPASVKDARAALRAGGLLPACSNAAPAHRLEENERARVFRRARRVRRDAAAVSFRGVWHELSDGPAPLRGVELEVARGDLVALMGRNGAGKTTLLRHAAGLLEATRGKVERSGRVGLVPQAPGDLLLHDRVADEAPAPALARAGLAGLGSRHPRDLSGGERQRLALAIVAGADAAPAALCLDEPTRGMDRAAKASLAARLRELASGGAAVLVATHDTEFAAAFARRVVLLASGRVIADGPAAEILAGGWYFATETARILAGAAHDALTAEEAASMLRARLALEAAP
jgi:energy-coupling factor transporter ATP-binding protein EcfA2